MNGRLMNSRVADPSSVHNICSVSYIYKLHLVLSDLIVQFCTWIEYNKPYVHYMFYEEYFILTAHTELQ